MEVVIYSLPNCPICNMIKTKLQNKNISYKEEPFSNIAATIKSDFAPALKVQNTIYNSPSEIVKWINEQ